MVEINFKIKVKLIFIKKNDNAYFNEFYEKKRIPRISYILGLIQAQKENYAGAVEHIKSYINLSPQAGDLDTARKQLTEIER